MGCDGSAGFGSSVAGGVGCSFSDGAEASGWRSDSSGVLDGSLTCDSVVPLSGCPDAGFVWIQLSDTPSVSSAEWSSFNLRFLCRLRRFHLAGSFVASRRRNRGGLFCNMRGVAAPQSQAQKDNEKKNCDFGFHTLHSLRPHSTR